MLGGRHGLLRAGTRSRFTGPGSVWSWVGGLCGLKTREGPRRLTKDGNGFVHRGSGLEIRLGWLRGVLRPGRISGFTGPGSLGRSWLGGLCGLKPRDEPRRLRQDGNGFVHRGSGLKIRLGGLRGVVLWGLGLFFWGVLGVLRIRWVWVRCGLGRRMIRLVVGFWMTGLLILRLPGMHSCGRGVLGRAMLAAFWVCRRWIGGGLLRLRGGRRLRWRRGVLVRAMLVAFWVCRRWIGGGLPSRRGGRMSRWRGCSWPLRSG